MNYYRHHLGDYAKKTMHLTMLEHGAYRLMIDYCYITERPLPTDVQRIYAVVRAQSKAERSAVDAVLAEFFTKVENGWEQNRITEELQIYTGVVEKNQQNGKLGGRPKKTQSVISGITQTETQSEPKHNLSQPPIANNQPPTTNHQQPELQTPKPKVKNIAPAAPCIRPETVSEKVWGDFLQIRKANRAPLTDTALAIIEREAGIAGISLELALSTACARGWRGFEAKWLNGNGNGKTHSNADEFDKAEQLLFNAKEKDITDDSERI